MLKEFKNKKPIIDESCFVAETSDVIGDVIVGENANIWYKAVLRGDINRIVIGKNTNIQDNTVVHVSDVDPTIIGDDVTVGHSCIIHGTKVGNNSLIGMGSILLDGSEIGEDTIIGAGSLVPQGKKIPSGVLALGSPAKVIRELTNEEKEGLKISAAHYVEMGRNHK